MTRVATELDEVRAEHHLATIQCIDIESIDEVPNPRYNKDTNNSVPKSFPSPLVAELDRPCEPGVTEGQRRSRDRYVKHRCAKSLVAMAKAEFGALEPTKVNECVVRAFMLREAKARNIKPHHLCGIITWAVHFYWIPTDYELEAMQ